jgi:AcrR family transcriptional regulator
LFGQRGFAATSTEEILEAASVSRGALYHHFRNKEDLFVAVYEATESDFANRIIVASATANDPLKQLRLGLDAFLDLCLEPEVQRILLLDGPTVLDWETWHEIDERYTFGLIQAALDEAVNRGLIERQPTTPLAHVLFGAAIQSAMVVARAENSDVAKRQMAKTLRRLLNALSSPR